MDKSIEKRWTSKDSKSNKSGNLFFSVINYQNNCLEVRKEMDAQDTYSACKFHYFHFLLKTGVYTGLIPFRLAFNLETGHHQLSKMNNFIKVQLKLYLTTYSILCLLVFIFLQSFRFWLQYFASCLFFVQYLTFGQH